MSKYKFIPSDKRDDDEEDPIIVRYSMAKEGERMAIRLNSVLIGYININTLEVVMYHEPKGIHTFHGGKNWEYTRLKLARDSLEAIDNKGKI